MKTKITATHTPERPYVGQPHTVYGQECRITKVYPYGTIDVVSLDGEHAYRVSGLAFHYEDGTLLSEESVKRNEPLWVDARGNPHYA